MRLKLTGPKLSEKSAPNQALRMINHWDQVDGTIERGYAGESIFFGRFGSMITQTQVLCCQRYRNRYFS
ncbi:hypothetical protein QK911_09790 [Lactococcus lactis]